MYESEVDGQFGRSEFEQSDSEYVATSIEMCRQRNYEAVKLDNGG
jgi:hypothetical protein